MRNILLLGAGTIGSLAAFLLSRSGDYAVYLGDHDESTLNRASGNGVSPNLYPVILDATRADELRHFGSDHPVEAVVSALPYFCNPAVAEYARESGLHYFDLSEDVTVTRHIRDLSRGAGTAFVPQCGLAPGYISIVASALMRHFEAVDNMKLRVGALPVHPSNVLKYSLTWSTDGLINEYGNVCYGIEDGDEVALMPLEGYETIEIDGLLYEAFNTSGGLGTLADTCSGQVGTLNYKTLRYPGHCEKIHFLMRDLKLDKDRGTLKRILENAIPKTLQDVVLIYVSASGRQGGELYEENYVKKLYPESLHGKSWSAIQLTTASSLCAVVDLVLERAGGCRGFVTQESILLADFLENRFGRYYRQFEPTYRKR